MRRILPVIAGALIVGLLAPLAFAQAPAPKVTITGLFDQIMSMEKNTSESNLTRSGDSDWYARTRFRPDFAFEVGRTKAVIGLELDYTYGQVGTVGGGPGKSTTAAGNSAQLGTTSDLGINNDTAGAIELKWIYTEFDLTGKDSLMPFIPLQTRARAGGQPFGSVATMKACVYACGDFAGFWMSTTFTPQIKTQVAYAMIEDETGSRKRGLPATTKITRGNDFSLITSADITPFKGLTIKPMYSLFHAEGVTTTTSRRAASNVRTVGGAINSLASFGGVAAAAPPAGAAANATAPGGNPSMTEDRHTIGFDASWRMGPFGLDPTILYQVGRREALGIQQSGAVALDEATINAWLIDITGSFQAGPFLLEVRALYTTGNDARDNLNHRVNYYEPLSTDTGYYASWAGIMALNATDFVPGLNGIGAMNTSVGYDRYGRMGFGIRGTYSLTPALDLFAIMSPHWTAKKVDTDTFTGATRVHATGNMQGDSRYIGTEGDIGFTFRFAPNVVYEMQGSYLFAGSANDVTEVANGAFVKRDARDAWAISSRLRLQF